MSKVRSKLAITASIWPGSSLSTNPAACSSVFSGSSPTTNSRAPGIRRWRKFAITSDEWMMSSAVTGTPSRFSLATYVARVRVGLLDKNTVRRPRSRSVARVSPAVGSRASPRKTVPSRSKM